MHASGLRARELNHLAAVGADTWRRKSGRRRRGSIAGESMAAVKKAAAPGMALRRRYGTGHSPHDNGLRHHEPLTELAGAALLTEQGSLAGPRGNPGDLAGTSSLPGSSSSPKIPPVRVAPAEELVRRVPRVLDKAAGRMPNEARSVQTGSFGAKKLTERNNSG